MEERITDIEIQLMHQESTIQQLNEVVISQQRQIELLLAEFAILKQQLQSVAFSEIRDEGDEVPPPHY